MEPANPRDALNAAGPPNPVRALRPPVRRRRRVLVWSAIGVASVVILILAPAGLRAGVLAVEAVTIIIGAIVSVAISTGGRLKSSDRIMDGMEAAHVKAASRDL